MKRRNFLQLLAAFAGIAPVLAKAKAVASLPPLNPHDPFCGCEPMPSVPIGTVSSFAGENVPSGWLPCDGRVLSQGEFPKLCEILGPPFKVIKLTPQPLMHALPDNPDHENLCGWHGEPAIELVPYQYIVKAK